MENGRFKVFALGALAGAAVGGAVALLFAPKRGSDTRAYIGDKLTDLKDTVGEKIEGVRQAMGEKICGAGERISGNGK